MLTMNFLLRHMKMYETASYRTTMSSMEKENDTGGTSWAVADDDMATGNLGR